MTRIERRIRLGVLLSLIGVNGAFAGEGKPITANDISGKKICWSNGDWVLYNSDGLLAGRKTGGKKSGAKWSVPEPGVLHIGRKYRQVEVLPDGQLHMYIYVLLIGGSWTSHDLDYWGSFCP